MSNYPQAIDIFTNKTGANAIASSDPNAAYDAIEATQGLIGGLGETQSWSVTLLTVLRKYKRDMRVEATGGSLYVRAGEAVLENSAGNIWVFRKNPSDVTVAAANLDAGTLAVGTYYVYITGGSAATTAPILFSTSAAAPAGYSPTGTGTGPCRQIGWFFNATNAVLAVTYAGDIKVNGNDVNMVFAGLTAATTFTLAATTPISQFTLPFISSGRPLEIEANCKISLDGAGCYGLLSVYLDNAVIDSGGAPADQQPHIIAIKQICKGIAAGPHTIEAKIWTSGTGTFYVYGTAKTTTDRQGVSQISIKEL